MHCRNRFTFINSDKFWQYYDKIQHFIYCKILNRKFDGILSQFKNLIKEIGIEQTSIENIFLKITKDENDEY